jgi:four helix bundle protein
MSYSHKGLRAWRRADSIRQRIIKLCAKPVVRRDFDFCRQADRAAASVCRNIAEGFARYGHTEFARFMVIARSSQAELLDTLDEALLKGYLDRPEYEELKRLVRSAIFSSGALRGYLASTPTPERRYPQKPPPNKSRRARQSPE